MAKNSSPPPNFGAQSGMTPQQQQDQGNQFAAKAAGSSPGKKAAPPPPDYSGAAQQQHDSSASNVNQQTTQNRPDINTGVASQQWTVGPDGRPVLNSSLAGPLASAQTGLMNQAAHSYSNPVDFSSLGALPTGDQARNQAIAGAYNQATSRLDPRFAQQDQLMQSQLANQGLDPHSEAYRTALQNYGQTKNDAYSSAMNGAIAQGTQAGNAIFNQGLAGRQQLGNEMLTQHNQPLADLGGLQGLQGFQPQFMGAGQAETTQYLPAAMAFGNYGLQSTEAQNQATADMFSGLGGLGAAIPGLGGFGRKR